MSEKSALLKAELQNDEAEIARLYQQLSAYPMQPEDDEQTIVVAYYLHNLYTAFEHVAELVANAFENQISDHTQWHAQLLQRMTLTVPGTRPRLWSDDAYDCLDELRRFRHVFRSAYKASLDPARLALVLTKADRLKTLYAAELRTFCSFLDSL